MIYKMVLYSPLNGGCMFEIIGLANRYIILKMLCYISNNLLRVPSKKNMKYESSFLPILEFKIYLILKVSLIKVLLNIYYIRGASPLNLSSIGLVPVYFFLRVYLVILTLIVVSFFFLVFCYLSFVSLIK